MCVSLQTLIVTLVPTKTLTMCVSLQTLTVTPVLTKTIPLVLKAAATPSLPAAVLPQRTPAVAMVTTAISKSDSLNAPINLQVTGKPTNQISEPVRLVVSPLKAMFLGSAC